MYMNLDLLVYVPVKNKCINCSAGSFALGLHLFENRFITVMIISTNQNFIEKRFFSFLFSTPDKFKLTHVYQLHNRPNFYRPIWTVDFEIHRPGTIFTGNWPVGRCFRPALVVSYQEGQNKYLPNPIV